MKKSKIRLSLVLIISILFSSLPSTIFTNARVMASQISQNGTAIEIRNSIRTVLVGKSITMSLEGTTKKPKWSSDNEKVASINTDTGELTARKAGTAVISAKLSGKIIHPKILLFRIIRFI